MADSVFDRDKFLLLQKRISLHAKYYVWDENNRVILFVEGRVRWPHVRLAAHQLYHPGGRRQRPP
jgi:hypothetical protein